MTEVTSGIIVRTRHMRKGGMCVDGSRTWFKSVGLDWREFVRNGLPVEVVEAKNGKTANDCCKIAREEHGG